MATVLNKDGVSAIIDPHIPTPSQATSGPYTLTQAVTPSDTVDLPFVAYAFQIGTGGTISVMDLDGLITQWTVASGNTLHARGKRVMATGTGALLIVAMA